MRRREKVELAAGVAVMVFAVWGGVRDCQNQKTKSPSNVPVAIVDPREGACTPAVTEAETLACPYGAVPGKVDGIDYGAPFEAGAGRCVWAGKLRLTTGRIAAVDPLVFLGAAAPLDSAVPLGDYPVVLRMHEGDVALALVLVATARPTRWAPARAAGRAETYLYGVDAGTGCYADAATAALLRGRQEAELERRVAMVKRRGIDPSDSAAWDRELNAIPTGLDLLQVMRGEGLDGSRWVNLCVDRATGANLVAFHSGAGDGSYPVSVGYDGAGKVAAFVTDFQIIDRAGRHPWIESLDPKKESAPDSRR